MVGIFLTSASKPNLAPLAIIGVIAGIFHGYAYGESIIGAQTIALGAYLLGFCSSQLAISAIAFYLGKSLLKRSVAPRLPLRWAGFAICGVGLVFLSSALG